jgi:hypothetical protein
VLTPASYGQPCGSCGGVVLCDGTCSKATPANLGAACGCGGVVLCDGSCSAPAAAPNYGLPCGTCGLGGTYLCDGSCSKPDPANLGQSCGHCGGTYQCDGSCSKPDPANYGTACGCENTGTIGCGGNCMGANKPIKCCCGNQGHCTMVCMSECMCM